MSTLSLQYSPKLIGILCVRLAQEHSSGKEGDKLLIPVIDEVSLEELNNAKKHFHDDLRILAEVRKTKKQKEIETKKVSS